MDKKRNPWLPYLAILAILLIWFVYNQFSGKQYEVQILPLFDIKPEKVTRVVISKDGERVTLVRMDSTWTFAEPDTGRPAEFRIEQFEKDVLRGEREGSITSDTAAYRSYGVADDAMHLEIWAGDNKVGGVRVGRSGKDFSLEYVRYDEDPHVYPSRQRMLNRVGSTADWWR